MPLKRPPSGSTKNGLCNETILIARPKSGEISLEPNMDGLHIGSVLISSSLSVNERTSILNILFMYKMAKMARTCLFLIDLLVKL